jgi:hypothetical protein
MNDMVSPSQSSPSIMGNAGQKTNSSAENAAIVRHFHLNFLFTFALTPLFSASDQAKTSGISKGSRCKRTTRWFVEFTLF